MAAADLSPTRADRLPRRWSAADRAASAGRAGFLAALLMLGAQLLWRLYWSQGRTIPSFPDLVVAAVSRLMPLSLFGAATENYGSLAKQSLFVAILVATAIVGLGAGVLAGRLSHSVGRGLVGRLLAGGAVGGGLLLVTLLVIAPIGHFGVFALHSSYTSGIFLRLVATFALYAVAWALLATPRSAAHAVTPAAGDRSISRRAVLRQAAWGALTVAGIGAVGELASRLFAPSSAATASSAAGGGSSLQEIIAKRRQAQDYPTPVPAQPVTEVVVGDEAALLADTAPAPNTAQLAALFGQLDSEKRITPILTATSGFYHVSKNISDPDVAAKGWKLTINGLVNEERTYTYDDIVRRATRKNITTLCCISNPINGDLISTAQWTGVPLVDLLKEAGVKPGAVDIKYHCADDYEDSMPVAKGLQDSSVMLVVGMNGVPLPPDHGGPARLIVPNLYGMKNAKWIERLEVVGKPFYGYWETQGWNYTAITQIWGRIDYPSDGAKLKAGPTTAAGIAAAGERGIKRVEVSLDGGKIWGDALLEPPLNAPFTWVRWAFPFQATPGDHTIVILATDGTGKLMDPTTRDPLPNGASGWPSRFFSVK